MPLCAYVKLSPTNRIFRGTDDVGDCAKVPEILGTAATRIKHNRRTRAGFISWLQLQPLVFLRVELPRVCLPNRSCLHGRRVQRWARPFFSTTLLPSRAASRLRDRRR